MTRSQTVLLSMYFVLLLICVGLWLAADNLSLATRDAILPIASDGFKTVLGATVGALSAMFGTKGEKP